MLPAFLDTGLSLDIIWTGAVQRYRSPGRPAGQRERRTAELRTYALVDFNLDERHPGRNLTERQVSLAAQLKCVPKTVQRRAATALDAVAVTLVSRRTNPSKVTSVTNESPANQSDSWQETLRAFWGLTSGDWVDVVCSEIPEDERPSYASPKHHNYLRYAKFVDLDSLVYVGRHIIQTLPSAGVRDFPPSEYSDAGTKYPGGTRWAVVPLLGGRKFGPRWTSTKELLTDVAVFVRLTLAQGTKVFLAAGCLTLGVYGAAMCFLHGEQGARNVAYVDARVGSRDFVVVTEVSRIGGIPDMADLGKDGPMLLLARGESGSFEIVVDDTEGKDYLPG